MTREEAIDILFGVISANSEEENEALDMAIEALERERTDEWCTDCKEYDTEKKCCPRFNRVIRGAIAGVLNTMPSANRPRGEWIDEGGTYYANCSKCGYQMDTHEERGYHNFCPNCGADMRGGDAT